MKLRLIPPVLSLLAICLLASCTTFKTTYDWEFYNEEAQLAATEGRTRSELRSSYPNAVVIERKIAGVSKNYGVVGHELWRIDANFVADVDFVYRINIPGGNFVPEKKFEVIASTEPLHLPETRPDDRVVLAKVVRMPIGGTTSIPK